MLTPDYLAHSTDVLLGMYDELDRAIISDISRRIVKTGRITESAKHQINKVQESGMLLRDVTKQVANTSGIASKEVKRMFEDAAVTGMKNDAKPLILNGAKVDLNLSSSMRQILDASIAKTNGDLRNLTMTLGVTANGKYLEAVNAAYMKVQSGAFSYSQAIRDAIKEAASDGNWVSYQSGHRSQLDVAVRRSVLTGLNQTAGKLTELYGADLGCEYYETSAHAGARPSHSVWQGRIFKIEGASGDYPNFADSTGYGTGEGLCGWNCRHSFYPYFPGLSVPAYTKEMLDWYDAERYEYNGDKLTEYEVSQLMRQCERNIRSTKREITAYQSALDETDSEQLRADLQADYETASVKLRRQREKYQDLCERTNHKQDSTRTSVVAVKDDKGRIQSFNQSAAQRSRRTYERVEKTANERYAIGSTQENVNRYISDEKTKKRLRSDSTNKTIMTGRQNKHILGSNNYTQGRSYLTISMEEAQKLVHQYAGTGDIKRSSEGVFSNKEVCIADRIIGVAVDPITGEEYETRKFVIHYAKKGTHIVPAREG